MFASAAHARSCEEEVLLLSVPSLSWQMVSFFVRGFGREKDGRCCCRTCRSRFMSLESKDAIAAIVCCLITCCCLRTKQKRRFWGEFSLTRLSRACLGKCLDLHEQMVQTLRLGFAPRPRHRSLCELGQVHHRLPDREAVALARNVGGVVVVVQPHERVRLVSHARERSSHATFHWLLMGDQGRGAMPSVRISVADQLSSFVEIAWVGSPHSWAQSLHQR